MGVDKLITALHGFLPIWKSSTINMDEIHVATPPIAFYISLVCAAKILRAFLNDYLRRWLTCALMSELTGGGEMWRKMIFQCKKERTRA